MRKCSAWVRVKGNCIKSKIQKYPKRYLLYYLRIRINYSRISPKLEHILVIKKESFSRRKLFENK
jgi:hypothetical protein